MGTKCQEAFLEDRTLPSQILTFLRLEGHMCFVFEPAVIKSK
jgi:hypothetical protein